MPPESYLPIPDKLQPSYLRTTVSRRPAILSIPPQVVRCQQMRFPPNRRNRVLKQICRRFLLRLRIIRWNMHSTLKRRIKRQKWLRVLLKLRKKKQMQRAIKTPKQEKPREREFCFRTSGAATASTAVFPENTILQPKRGPQIVPRILRKRTIYLLHFAISALQRHHGIIHRPPHKRCNRIVKTSRSLHHLRSRLCGTRIKSRLYHQSMSTQPEQKRKTAQKGRLT